MTDTTVRKKVLEKVTQKEAAQKSGSTDTTLQHEAIAPSTVEINCILNQGDHSRVMVFINGANLSYAASHLSIEIDYVKLLDYLTAGGCLVQAFFYTGCDPTNDKQREFLHWMRHNGFCVITKMVETAGDDTVNLDVEIAVDMMRLSQHCDTAMLVSGDEDFAYVVNAIASRGVRVEVVGLRSMTSDSLIDTADCYIDLAAIQKTVQKLGGSV